MVHDIQKASFWKRISAYIFDMIMLVIVAVGIAFLLSTLLGYDSYSDRLNACYTKYEEEYGIDFDITEEDYTQMSDAEKEIYTKATEALASDSEANYVYTMMFYLTLLIVTFSILAGYLLLEFVVPLIFKNGQTLGKKIFGIAVMRVDGVKLSPLQLFVRTLLGKYTIETMLPVLILIMLFFNAINAICIFVIAAIGLIQIVMLITTRTNSAIHDKFSGTVAVDMASQMIFETVDDMIEYKKKLHADEASRQKY